MIQLGLGRGRCDCICANIILSCLAVLLFATDAFAQNALYNKHLSRDPSIYGEMQRAWISQDGISYATFPYSQPLGDRRLDLIDGEGRNGYLVEANLDLRFPFLMGRPNNSSLKRRQRFTIDYRANFRMTNDSSKPLVPWSNYFGIGHDFTIFDSKKKWVWNDKGRGDSTSLEPNEKFKFLTLTTFIHHFSNGQPPGFYTYSSDSTERRNDYTSGDFSTNYLKFILKWSIANIEKHRLTTLGISYRMDGGYENTPLVFTPEQERSYGRKRIGMHFDYYTGPNSRMFRADQEWHFRTELTYITDELDLFTPNLKEDQGEYRLMFHQFVELRPLNHRTIGYLVHFYAGRDYMNIRYDDVIWMVQFGISLSVDKYYPIGWQNEVEGKL